MGCHALCQFDSRSPSSQVAVRRAVDILESGGVLLSPGYTDFRETVEALVDQLIQSGQLAAGARGEAVAAVCQREELSSTVMVEIGVSIPHARLTGVDGVIGSLAMSPTAVYHAMAGVPISIVILVLSSPDLAGEHLNVLAGLSMLLQSQSVRDAIGDATDPRQVIDLLREQADRRSA